LFTNWLCEMVERTAKDDSWSDNTKTTMDAMSAAFEDPMYG